MSLNIESSRDSGDHHIAAVTAAGYTYRRDRGSGDLKDPCPSDGSWVMMVVVKKDTFLTDL